MLFNATVGELSIAPRPPTDTARLAKWFVYLTCQQSLLKTITAQLRASHAISAQRLTAPFIKNGNVDHPRVPRRPSHVGSVVIKVSVVDSGWGTLAGAGSIAALGGVKRLELQRRDVADRGVQFAF
jgi:hypothetical protein